MGGQLDVFFARKLGLPAQPELGVGAVAEGGELLDGAALFRLGLSPDDLAAIVEQERAELVRRVERYRGDRSLPELSERQVVLVDDGLATESTARAALRALRGAGPARLVLAVPVCAPAAAQAFEPEADEVVCVLQPEAFRAVAA